MLLHNASSHLVVGGRFVGTVPNANWLMCALPRRCIFLHSVQPPVFVRKKLRQTEGTRFANAVYSVQFDDKDARPFGHPYTFHLVDAVEDVPEFITPIPVLKRLALDYGLELKLCDTFHQFFYDNCCLADHFDLLRKMQVLQSNRGGVLSEDEWEVAGIYLVFVFEKVRPWRPPTN